MNSISFTDLNLLPQIERALKDLNYTTPTPIQAEAIPHVLQGNDLLGIAQTGTGKTAAFALPVLHHLGLQNRRSVPKAPRCLILSPTRELAAQIDESLKDYGAHLRLRSTVIFGGVGQGKQVRALSKGVHILVATPGRLLDLMQQGHIRLDHLEVFVLDEADRMLDMGFAPDLKRIIAKLPEERQSLFFSATMAGKISELASGLLQDPVRVDIAPETTTVERIEQQVLFVQHSEKQNVLHNLLKAPEVDKVLVFTRTKRGADKVAKQLNQNGQRAEAIHGNKSQNARTRTLDKFRSPALRVLVATDVAARGIDVDGVTHVINYDVPVEPEAYVHRIGRTGRAGASGIAFTFCDSQERSLLRQIERLIRKRIDVHADHPGRGGDREDSKGGPRRPAGSRGRSRKAPPHAQRGSGNSRPRRKNNRGPKRPAKASS